MFAAHSLLHSPGAHNPRLQPTYRIARTLFLHRRIPSRRRFRPTWCMAAAAKPNQGSTTAHYRNKGLGVLPAGYRALKVVVPEDSYRVMIGLHTSATAAYTMLQTQHHFQLPGTNGRAWV